MRGSVCLSPDGSFLLADGIKYRIDRAEKVYAGDEIFYIWAIIRVMIEEDENE